MTWLIIGVIAAVGLAYLMGKSDGEKDGFVDATAYYESKDEQKRWMEMMTRYRGDNDEQRPR